jgi:hypothetical protein
MEREKNYRFFNVATPYATVSVTLIWKNVQIQEIKYQKKKGNGYSAQPRN